MTTISDTRAETVFEDYKPPYGDAQAFMEANRCLFCVDAPCVTACPTSIDIPQFIRKIATANVRGSARTILASNILGRACARVCPVEVLCVGECVLNEAGIPPIQVGKLQRYSTDKALNEGWRFFEAGADSGKSVGLVGGGPATIAAAHELRRHGHACTIYEKRDVLGGLNTWGVAPYKLTADASVEEIDHVLAIGGVEVRYGAAVGVDVSWDELLEKHDALFIGFGLGPDRHLGLPGEDLKGVYGAVENIEMLKLRPLEISGAKQVVIVGGGNTAIDCVREAQVFGGTEVVMVYRRDEASMSGYAHEWDIAKVKGARGEWRALPVAYEGGEQVERVRCVRLDDQRQPIAGSEFVVPAEIVLVAVGQGKLGDLVAPLGLNTEWGRIVVDEQGATSRAGVWAGGDCVNGGKEVVNAVADGQNAAIAIDRYLQGGNNG